MGKHTHNKHCHCAHDVDYCPICNVCYCKKCGVEWGRNNWFYTYPYTYTIPNTWEYSSGNISSGEIKVTCNHSTA